MKKSIEKLEHLLQRGYRIISLQYYWNEDDDHYTTVYLFNEKEDLKTIDGKGKEGFEIIVYAHDLLKKIGKSKRLINLQNPINQKFK